MGCDLVTSSAVSPFLYALIRAKEHTVADIERARICDHRKGKRLRMKYKKRRAKKGSLSHQEKYL